MLGTNWYLLRTQAGEEQTARSQVSRLTADVLLPLLKVRVRRRNRMVASVAPLFPGYMFARLDFERAYARLRYTRGLRGMVCFGGQPAVVPEWLIGELKQHCEHGPVELPERMFVPRERVMVIDGPFREFDGIFERYLSGSERVAILFSTMGAGPGLVAFEYGRPCGLKGSLEINKSGATVVSVCTVACNDREMSYDLPFVSG